MNSILKRFVHAASHYPQRVIIAAEAVLAAVLFFIEVSPEGTGVIIVAAQAVLVLFFGERQTFSREYVEETFLSE